MGVGATLDASIIDTKGRVSLGGAVGTATG